MYSLVLKCLVKHNEYQKKLPDSHNALLRCLFSLTLMNKRYTTRSQKHQVQIHRQSLVSLILFEIPLNFQHLFIFFSIRFSGSKCGGQPYAHIAVPLDSEMYFVCPSVVMLSKLQIGYVSKTNMYENMYMVTKKQFDECNITEVDGEKTKRVMLCDSPKNPNKLTFNRFFFTSLTTQIAFLPNTTYYFIGKPCFTPDKLCNPYAISVSNFQVKPVCYSLPELMEKYSNHAITMFL